jgi:hypothetical protein
MSTGEYVEVTKITKGQHVILSNGDVLFKATTMQRGWYVTYKKSKYTERIINKNETTCQTFREAIESYQNRTGNCLIGSLSVLEIGNILSLKKWFSVTSKDCEVVEK